ncbi:MAG: Bacterial Ig domain, partial [Paenibacillaceae bacterium]|nr:Bacterial Ig domain [Paenibacillaceae bacterium]
NGGTVYSAVAAADGSFTVSLSPNILAPGDVVSITAQSNDPSKGVSPAVTYTVPGRTAIPIITPLLRANYTVVKGTSEASAHIVITINGGSTTYEGDASSAGAYSINVPLLNQNDTVKVTAKASSKSTSYPATMVVEAASSNPPASDSGVVLDVAPDGQTVIGFQDVYTTTNQLVITSGLGSYSTDSNIDLVAAQGITIQSGVSLTTTNTGSGSGLSLTTTGGDVVVNNASLTNSGSSSFSTIEIDSAGNVYLQGAVLSAERTITIKAAGNIYLDNAVFDVKQNAAIILQLTSSSGVITVSGLKLSMDADASIPTTPAPGAKVCGVMSNTSTGGIKVNGGSASKSFTCN